MSGRQSRRLAARWTRAGDGTRITIAAVEQDGERWLVVTTRGVGGEVRTVRIPLADAGVVTALMEVVRLEADRLREAIQYPCPWCGGLVPIVELPVGEDVAARCPHCGRRFVVHHRLDWYPIGGWR